MLQVCRLDCLLSPLRRFFRFAGVLSSVFFILWPLTACSNSPHASTLSPSSLEPLTSAPGQIVVFAASSGRAALEAAGRVFQAKTGTSVYFNFGGSGALLSQLKLARTGDVFLPASPEYLTKAADEGVASSDSGPIVYYLVPAILVQKGNPQNIRSLSDLSRPGLRVAIADPATVPAGRYAYELLAFNHTLAEIGKNVTVYGDSNEKISTYVILKTVDAAIGWDTVALQQPQDLDVIYLPAQQLPRISYVAGAVTTFSRNRDAAWDFLTFLSSTEGHTIFAEKGYRTTEAEARLLAPNAQIGGVYELPEDYEPLVR